MPIYAQAKVHRDYHIQVGRALYSIPEHLRGQTFSVRADGELAKAFFRGKLVKTHPRQPSGGRALELDVVSVSKIAAILHKATENTPVEPARAATGLAPARFARDPGEYRPQGRQRPDWLSVIDGGVIPTSGNDGTGR